MTARWRWALVGAAVVAVGVVGAVLVLDRLDRDDGVPVFAEGEGPGYFPSYDAFSDAMFAPVYAPQLNGDTPITDVSAGYEWSQRRVGGGGWVKGVEVHPTGSLEIARTDVGGAYRFDRDTEEWVQLIVTDAIADPDLREVNDYYVEAVGFSASDPDRIYLSAGQTSVGGGEDGGRVLTSLDGGETWRPSEQRFEIHGNGPSRQGGERIGAKPSDPDDVWLGTTDGLWRSTDGAVTFFRVDAAPRGNASVSEASGIEWVLVRDEVVYIGVAGVGVLASEDDGAAWTTLWSTETRPFDAVTDDAGILWAVDAEDEILRRYDPAVGEAETVSSPTGDDLGGLAVTPDGQTVVVLTDDEKLWRSVDGGDSWDSVTPRFSCPDIPWVESFDFTLFTSSSPSFDPVEPNRLWVPNGFGMWTLPDVTQSEITLECRVDGIEELVVNDIVVNETDTVVITSWDRPAFHLPPGGAATGTVGPTDRINSGWDLAATPADPNRLALTIGDIRFCCEADGQAYVSVTSADGGRSWEPFASHDGDHPETLRYGNIAISSTDPSNLVWLPSWDGAVHVSRDGGDSWAPVILPGTEDRRTANGTYTGGSHFQYYLQREVLLADPVDGDRFYLFHSDLGLFRSDDGGSQWELISPDGLPTGWTVGHFNAQLSAVPGRAGHLLYTPGELVEGFFPLYESTDGGETWSVVPSTSDVSVVGFGVALDGGDVPTMYLAGAIEGRAGLWRSPDLMATWEFIGESAGGRYHAVTAISGDPEIPGRVYVTFAGVGVMEGDG